MNEYVLQGIASQFEKPFIYRDQEIMMLKSGVFTESMRSGTDIKLLLDHDTEKCLGTWTERLLIHAGEKSLVFRFLIPESWNSKFSELANEYDSYIPVSIGFEFKNSNTEIETINGVKVKSVLVANLTEISLLSTAPAVSTTYARVVSWETCSSLQEDCESGMLDLVGRYVSIHRNLKAWENGGRVEYSNSTSPSDRAATAFTKALSNMQT